MRAYVHAARVNSPPFWVANLLMESSASPIDLTCPQRAIGLQGLALSIDVSDLDLDRGVVLGSDESVCKQDREWA
jgi:hypothetical protein